MEQYRMMIPESAFCPFSGKIMMDPVHLGGDEVYDRCSLSGMAATMATSNKHVSRMIKEMLVIVAKQWKKDEEVRLHNLLTTPSKDPHRIFIKTTTSKVYTVHIDPQQSVYALKNEIANEISVSVDQMRLVCKGKQMEDDRSLVDYEITTDSEVHLVLRLRGGMLHPSSGRFGYAVFGMLSSDMYEFIDTMMKTFRSRRMEDGGGGGCCK